MSINDNDDGTSKWVWIALAAIIVSGNAVTAAISIWGK